jgi:hypothetical protein
MHRARPPRWEPRLLTLVFYPSGSGKCICNRVRRHGNKSVALKRRASDGGFQGGVGCLVNVRYTSNSDQILRRSEMTRSANRRHRNVLDVIRILKDYEISWLDVGLRRFQRPRKLSLGLTLQLGLVLPKINHDCSD